MSQELELLRKLWRAWAIEGKEGDDVFAELGAELQKLVERQDAETPEQRRP